MKTQVCVLAIIACLASLQSFAAEEEYQVEIRPISLEIVSLRFETNRTKPFNFESRMVLGLLVESKNVPLVAVDIQGCKMEKLTDDTGASLNKPLATPDFFSPISSKAKGNAACIQFTASTAPAKGAKEITASGELKVIFGSKKETFELKDITLKVQALDIPQYKFSIIRISEQLGLADPDKHFETPVPMNNICFRLEGKSVLSVESITFSDKAGNPIKAQKGWERFSTSGVDQPSSYAEWEYLLPKDVNMTTVTIRIWKELKTRTVPFSFTTGIGL